MKKSFDSKMKEITDSEIKEIIDLEIVGKEPEVTRKVIWQYFKTTFCDKIDCCACIENSLNMYHNWQLI